MVSGFLISPYDHDRIFSGLAIEIRIWSKTCAGTCGLNRFINSWFILVSSLGGISLVASRDRIQFFEVMPREGGVPSNHRRRGLLDRPPARAMTEWEARFPPLGVTRLPPRYPRR